MAIFLK